MNSSEIMQAVLNPCISFKDTEDQGADIDTESVFDVNCNINTQYVYLFRLYCIIVAKEKVQVIVIILGVSLFWLLIIVGSQITSILGVSSFCSVMFEMLLQSFLLILDLTNLAVELLSRSSCCFFDEKVFLKNELKSHLMCKTLKTFSINLHFLFKFFT
ncbi:hypothetical protein Ahy_A10g046907 isoform E [Arachis hypogaea]|uniref:Uncharacterized protein n=1 Tax=Arachis hypogaea TaxID=3818 RepID=A0A445B0Y3_ARAHY|nr:hypothetical protein Ahy_A10g046907 isoform E [Arachis hypogaea]